MPFQALHPCLETEDAGKALVIHFKGRKVRLGEQHLQILQEQLAGLDEAEARPLLLDFANVECLASTALGLIVALNNKLKAAGSRLTLYDVAPHIEDVFEITKLTNVLDIHKRGEELTLLPLDPTHPGPGNGDRTLEL